MSQKHYTSCVGKWKLILVCLERGAWGGMGGMQIWHYIRQLHVSLNLRPQEPNVNCKVFIEIFRLYLTDSWQGLFVAALAALEDKLRQTSVGRNTRLRQNTCDTGYGNIWRDQCVQFLSGHANTFFFSYFKCCCSFFSFILVLINN